MDLSTSSQQQRLMIRDQILKKIIRTQETSSGGAYPQVHYARSASRDAGKPFMGCVRPVHTFQGREKLTWGFLVIYSWF